VIRYATWLKTLDRGTSYDSIRIIPKMLDMRMTKQQTSPIYLDK